MINKNCIVNACDSAGHLSGKALKHRQIETCPISYGLNLNDVELIKCVLNVLNDLPFQIEITVESIV